MNSLDFIVLDSNNPKVLIVQDTSLYDSAMVAPQITITPPGFNGQVISFVPRKTNVFNSNSLGLTTVTDVASLQELPDGIYKLSYTGTAQTAVIKTYLKVDKLMCKLNNAILCMDVCDINSSRMTELKGIEFMIMGAVANANGCNAQTAIALYQRAELELDAIIKRCN